MRLGREGSNPQNDRIRFANDIWSDPTGTMTQFSSGDAENSKGVSIRNCLYFNGGQPIPVDPGRRVNVTDDPKAIVEDPKLPDRSQRDRASRLEPSYPALRRWQLHHRGGPQKARRELRHPGRGFTRHRRGGSGRHAQGRYPAPAEGAEARHRGGRGPALGVCLLDGLSVELV